VQLHVIHIAYCGIDSPEKAGRCNSAHHQLRRQSLSVFNVKNITDQCLSSIRKPSSDPSSTIGSTPLDDRQPHFKSTLATRVSIARQQLTFGDLQPTSAAWSRHHDSPYPTKECIILDRFRHQYSTTSSRELWRKEIHIAGIDHLDHPIQATARYDSKRALGFSSTGKCDSFLSTKW